MYCQGSFWRSSSFLRSKDALERLAAVSGAVIMVVVLASSGLMRDRFELAFTEMQRADAEKMTSVGNRIYLYKITPQLIAEAPARPWDGLLPFRDLPLCEYPPQGCHGWISWHPHNQFLLFFAADHGALGFAAYLFLLISMAWMARQTADPEIRVLLIGLAALRRQQLDQCVLVERTREPPLT